MARPSASMVALECSPVRPAIMTIGQVKIDRLITGGCSCEAVSYSLVGPLNDARSCHCSMCRRIFAAQASVCTEVDPEKFSWVKGEDQLTSHVGEQDYGVQFCRHCGSTLCIIYKGAIHSLTLGCVDGDPEMAIARHIFVGSKASWEVMPEAVTQFDEYPE